jgi:hypothetical protein
VLGGFEHGIQAGSLEQGIGPLVEVVVPSRMDTVNDGVGNGDVPLAELAQQRLGPATSFASGLSLKHALLENVVEDEVILDVERYVTHCFHLFHDRRDGPAQLSENHQTGRRVAPRGRVEFRDAPQDTPDVVASIAVPAQDCQHRVVGRRISPIDVSDRNYHSFV